MLVTDAGFSVLYFPPKKLEILKEVHLVENPLDPQWHYCIKPPRHNDARLNSAIGSGPDDINQ